MCRNRTQPNRLKTKAAYCLACLLTLTLCANAAEEYYSGGTGEPNTPFKISKPADWQELMTTEAHWDKHFILTADLDLNDVAITQVGYTSVIRWAGCPGDPASAGWLGNTL